MTRTNIRSLGGISLLLLASTTFGFLATEEESGANAALEPIYSQISTRSDAKSVEELCSKTAALFRKGEILVTQDQYRAAAILSKSNRLDRLQLAHDLSLAALHEGFLPAKKVLSATQNQILKHVGVDDVTIAIAEPYVPLDRPSFARPGSGAKGGVEVSTATAEAAATSMIQLATPRK